MMQERNSTVENTHQTVCKKSYNKVTLLNAFPPSKFRKGSSFHWLFGKFLLTFRWAGWKNHPPKKNAIQKFPGFKGDFFQVEFWWLNLKLIFINPPPANIWGPLTYIKGFCPLSVSKPWFRILQPIKEGLVFQLWPNGIIFHQPRT